MNICFIIIAPFNFKKDIVHLNSKLNFESRHIWEQNGTQIVHGVALQTIYVFSLPNKNLNMLGIFMLRTF